MERPEFINLVMTKVRSKLHSYGQQPSEDIFKGLSEIVSTIWDMSTNQPSLGRSFYVSSLACGTGKTVSMLEAVKHLGKDTGVIIFLNRVLQIEEQIKELGLSNDEFAALVSDAYPETQALGNRDHSTARILFTTQQMLEARVKDGTPFAKIKDFWFEGKPRLVRIWDEAIQPTKSQTFNNYDLARAYGKFGQARLYPKLTSQLLAFAKKLDDTPDKAVIQIPAFFDSSELQDITLEGMLDPFSDQDDRKGVEELYKLSGRVVRVRNIDRVTALSYEDIFPDDAAPMLVLDASGHLRSVYDQWQKSRRNLCRLHSPEKHYRGLTIHHWERGSGRDQFKPKGKSLQTIIDGIVSTIKQIPADEKILVLHLLPAWRIADVEMLITDQIGSTENVSFLTMGKHTGTNLYQDHKHVIMASLLQYSTPQNEAIARGAQKLTAEDDVSDDDINDIRLGEVDHNLLQAANRGLIRKTIKDGCPPGCHLYMIFSSKSYKPDRLNEIVFKGAALVPWEPVPKVFRGNAKKLLEYLRPLVGNPPTLEEVRTALGSSTIQQIHSLLRRKDVKQLLASGEIKIVDYEINKRGRPNKNNMKEQTNVLSEIQWVK